MVGGEHGVRLGGNAGQKRNTRLAGGGGQVAGQPRTDGELRSRVDGGVELARIAYRADTDDRFGHRSEEHTSELQSLMRISYAVFCLKKKKIQLTTTRKYVIKHMDKHVNLEHT